jgi:modification methylase
VSSPCERHPAAISAHGPRDRHPPSAGTTPTPSQAEGAGLPLAVWPYAQTGSPFQRAGRYLPASTAHPAKMLAAIARYAIAAYT